MAAGDKSLIHDAVVRKTILDAVELGAFQLHAARAAGIPPKTLDDWLQRGSGNKPDPSGIYTKFFEELEIARGKAIIKNLELLRKIAETPKGAHAITWLLSKLDPKRYGDRIEIKAEVSHRKIYSFIEPAISVVGEVLTPPKELEMEGADDD